MRSKHNRFSELGTASAACLVVSTQFSEGRESYLSCDVHSSQRLLLRSGTQATGNLYVACVHILSCTSCCCHHRIGPQVPCKAVVARHKLPMTFLSAIPMSAKVIFQFVDLLPVRLAQSHAAPCKLAAACEAHFVRFDVARYRQLAGHVSLCAYSKRRFIDNLLSLDLERGFVEIYRQRLTIPVTPDSKVAC